MVTENGSDLKFYIDLLGIMRQSADFKRVPLLMTSF